MKSITLAASGQPLPVKVVMLFTRAIFAAVADRFDVPAASGGGRFAPTAPLDASCTRKYLPGANKHGPLGQSGVTDQVVPADAACWTDQPARSTLMPPRLKISIKSFL